jgi:N-acetylneuraminic acid mutarotase
MMEDKRATLIVSLFLCSLLVVLPNVTAVSAAEDSWATLEPMSAARASVGVAVVDGKIYAIGGGYDSCGVEEYDPATNTWTTKTPMPTPRMWFGIAVVEKNIYVIGGDAGNWEVGIAPTNVNEVYDPATDTWETLTPMPTKRMAVSANVVDGKIYVIGGGQVSPNTKFKVNQVYDPETDTWTTKTPVPTGVEHHTSAVVDNKIYVIGGAVGVTLNQIYDTETDTWSNGSPLPEGVDAAAAAATSGVYAPKRIYVVGGKQNLDAVNFNQIYDPETDTWSTGTSMPTARYGLGVAIIDDVLYAIGGREGWIGAPISAANEQYIPADYVAKFYSQSFDAGTWEDTRYDVFVVSNSTVSDFSFNHENTLIRFDVEGEEGTIGFCNVTIPKNLLDAENTWAVLVDGTSVTPTVNKKENYTNLHFTYSHSTKTVEIIGTDAIPEFPSWTILPLLIVATLVGVIIRNKIIKNGLG